MSEKYSCPKCGKELATDDLLRGICSKCRSILPDSLEELNIQKESKENAEPENAKGGRDKNQESKTGSSTYEPLFLFAKRCIKDNLTPDEKIMSVFSDFVHNDESHKEIAVVTTRSLRLFYFVRSFWKGRWSLSRVETRKLDQIASVSKQEGRKIDGQHVLNITIYLVSSHYVFLGEGNYDEATKFLQALEEAFLSKKKE